MRIIYNNLIPVPGFSAIMLFGVIFARKSAKPLSGQAIRHERIHKAQAKECGGYVPYYLLYLTYWIHFGYRAIPFEREAYDKQGVMFYLDNRPKYAWKTYLK